MIYCIIGKSATGKDTIYKKILNKAKEKPDLQGLKTIVPYTTRPCRNGEKDGVEYHFRSVKEYREMEAAGNVIESRCYHTVHGDWYYFTADDGQIKPDEGSCLLIMTLEGYESLRKYYGKEKVMPIYIEVEDGLRLTRALEREKQQQEPKYAELCRRFLADQEDFSEEKIKQLGISARYFNIDAELCTDIIVSDIIEAEKGL